MMMMIGVSGGGKFDFVPVCKDVDDNRCLSGGGKMCAVCKDDDNRC